MNKKLAIFLLSCLGVAFSAGNAFSYKLKTDNGKAALSSKEASNLASLSQGLADIAEHTRKALVYISVSKTMNLPKGYIDPFEFFFGPGGRGQSNPQKKQGLGSGFFIDLGKGYVMTNNHVVEGADEIELKLANGKTYDAKIVGRDKNTDIAIVQIKNKSFSRRGLGALILSQREPKVGEFSVALGAPFGLQASISFGVLSALGRNNLKITKLGNFIQTDAAINPGNSGGPLVDMKGKVIGINTAIYSKSGGYNGIGFAVPSKLARNVAEKLINHGKVVRGYIGVGLQELTEEIAEGLGLPADQQGALVRGVQPDGPAKSAGLKPGDVIIKVDGKKIESEDALILAVGTKTPGEKIKVTVIRDKREKSISLKVSKWPGDNLQAESVPPQDSGDETFGMVVSSLSSQLRNRYGFSSRSGVVVTRVVPGSVADRSGVQEGDVIVTINSQTISDTKAFSKAVKKKKKLLVRLERKNDFLFIALVKPK